MVVELQKRGIKNDTRSLEHFVSCTFGYYLPFCVVGIYALCADSCASHLFSNKIPSWCVSELCICTVDSLSDLSFMLSRAQDADFLGMRSAAYATSPSDRHGQLVLLDQLTRQLLTPPQSEHICVLLSSVTEF